MNINISVENLEIHLPGGAMSQEEEHAKTMLEDLDKNFLQHLPVMPNSFAYVHLYTALQELLFQKNYDLVADICKAVRCRVTESKMQ